MSEWREYNSVCFDGSMLKPSFSVYLFEITFQKDKFFYVGMTGDNVYPSARSAIHRLSGHFELSKKSNQNQIIKALSEKKIDIQETTITMHHWPIAGFNSWENSLKKFNKNELNEREFEYYKYYKLEQSKVFELEHYLINLLKNKLGASCLNKNVTTVREVEDIYQPIVEHVLKITV